MASPRTLPAEPATTVELARRFAARPLQRQARSPSTPRRSGLDPYRDRLCLVQLSRGRRQRRARAAPPALRRARAEAAARRSRACSRSSISPASTWPCSSIVSASCRGRSTAPRSPRKLARTFTDRHGLKDLCRELLGIELSKQQQSSDWGAAELTPEQLNLCRQRRVASACPKGETRRHAEARGREGLARACFEFLPTRVELDLRGWSEIDPFAH